MINYSENEREFFRKLFFDFDIRYDGREKLAIRTHDIASNVITSCLSSLKLIYNESQKEMLFTIKGELTSVKQDLFNVNIDSMYKIEDMKLKKEIENYLMTLILNKIEPEAIDNELYWKVYIDIFIFDTIKMSILQMLAIGLKELIRLTKFPKVITFTNEVTKIKEYDLLANYEDLTVEENEYLTSISNIPDVFVFAILNNSIYLDPTEEELSVANSIVLISAQNGRILNVQSVGSSVDVQKILDITSLIKTF